jgi:hypothetical protein
MHLLGEKHGPVCLKICYSFSVESFLQLLVSHFQGEGCYVTAVQLLPIQKMLFLHRYAIPESSNISVVSGGKVFFFWGGGIKIQENTKPQILSSDMYDRKVSLAIPWLL